VGYVSEAVQGATSKAYSNLQLPASIYFSDQLFYVPFAHEGINKKLLFGCAGRVGLSVPVCPFNHREGV
jgi:hypothetical protein